MASLNRVELIGRLGKDPEARQAGGQTVCNFRIATDESWTDKSGQRQEKTEWHAIVAWGKLGDLCSQHLSKGRLVFIEGSLETREWVDKENVKRWSTEVKARNVQFLDRAPERAQQSAATSAPPAANNGDW